MEQLGVHSGANSWDMETHGVLLIVAMYLAFVLWLGPAAMKNRPPYKLTRTLLVYNGAQVVVSAYLAIISFREILQFGFLPRKCYMEEHWNLVNLRNQLYCIAKISELLDTIFFVLRKKNSQITFLHVYHHTGMVFSWVIFKNHPSHLSVFVRCINSFVHVVMYAYYGLAALGPHVAQYLKWKKYLTSLQLVQFAVLLIYSVATERVSECPSSIGRELYFTGNIIFVAILFGNFYKQSYIKKKSETNTDDHSNICMLQSNDLKDD